MRSFYVTLPGAVKSSYHDNVLSDYVTHLPRTVELEGKWEVALVELHVTKSWYNVEKDMWIGIRDTMDRTDLADSYLNAGKYSIEDLVRVVNEILGSFRKEEPVPNPRLNNAKIMNTPNLRLDPFSKKLFIIPGITEKNRLIFPDMDSQLLEVLGLTNRMNPTRFYNIIDGEPMEDFMLETLLLEQSIATLPIKGPPKGERAVDIEAGIHAIYVYSDIVEENLIGDSSAPCLRVCSLPKTNFGETINLQFDQPHYSPVSSRSFQTIRITLKDKTNEKIKFQFGETLVKLHFRQHDI